MFFRLQFKQNTKKFKFIEEIIIDKLHVKEVESDSVSGREHHIDGPLSNK